MNTANEHVFSHGMEDTRAALHDWSERHWVVLRAWLALSLAIALALLAAVWVVAGMLTPDITPIHLPGLTEPSDPGDLLPILWRNSLVLALHATACIAGFIAGSSMPIAAAQRSGVSRWIHVKAGELAILFVCAVTLSRSRLRRSTWASRARRSPSSCTSRSRPCCSASSRTR